MKLKKFDEFKNELLTERVYNIDDDIDLLYDLYFKEDIDEIGRTGKLNKNMFKPNSTNTDILKSEQCRKAHDIKPCVIIINDSKTKAADNYFDTNNSIISLSISKSAFNFVVDDFNGDLGSASDYESRGVLINEFKELRIKGVISHELTHWMDQCFNNKSVERFVKHRIDNPHKIKTNVNSEHIELNSQIASINQMRKHFSKLEWDRLTFDDLMKRNVSLYTVNNMLYGREKLKWKRDLKTRMYRERLLGKNMY